MVDFEINGNLTCQMFFMMAFCWAICITYRVLVAFWCIFFVWTKNTLKLKIGNHFYFHFYPFITEKLNLNLCK